MNNIETNREKKFKRSNKRKTRVKKGCVVALAGTLSLSSCKNKESDVTKLSKQYDAAIEKVENIKQDIKDKEEEIVKDNEELKKDSTDLQTLRQNLINAEETKEQKLLDAFNKAEETKKKVEENKKKTEDTKKVKKNQKKYFKV